MLCTGFWGIDSLKNNSAVSRSGYLYGVNQKYSLVNAFFPYKKYNQKLHAKFHDGKWKKRFANTSIPFVILCIMKLLTQINILFPQNLK